MRLLVAGISTRAAAAAARRAGVADVVGLDYFGDRDQRRAGETYALEADFGLPRSPESLAVAAARLRYDAVAYTASLENHPTVVARLCAGGGGTPVLLGNTPRTLQRARHVPLLARVCRREGIAFPATALRAVAPPADGVWLRKPRAAGGGHGIRPWAAGDEPPGRPARMMLQRYVAGTPFSATFVANGRDAVVVGLAEGLAGLPEFGARGFSYCGNLLPPRGDASRWSALPARLEAMATVLTRAFGLRGVNGMDLIAGARGTITLLEINPRYSASMELIERAWDVPLFAWHMAAITTGRLPRDGEVAARLAGGGATWGKAILYARRDVVAPDTDPWLARGVCDVPGSGEAIPAGAPVCTLIGGPAGDGDRLLADLKARAAWIERSLGLAAGGAARAMPDGRRSPPAAVEVLRAPA